MKIIKPETIGDFIERFEGFNNSGEIYYRGQADAAWPIVPGLGRHEEKLIYNKIEQIEQQLIQEFKAKIQENNLTELIPLTGHSYHEDWQWWMAAQHYGLPTRFLDFSHDKFSAIQFAVADLQKLNSDGALIIYLNSNLAQCNVDSSLLKNPFQSIDKTFFLQAIRYGSKDNNENYLSERRKTIQGSKFLYREIVRITECLSLDNCHSNNLIKLLIPKEFKPSIIEYLILQQQLAFDIYAGKNAIDYYAAIIKNQFMNLKIESDITREI